MQSFVSQKCLNHDSLEVMTDAYLPESTGHLRTLLEQPVNDKLSSDLLQVRLHMQVHCLGDLYCLYETVHNLQFCWFVCCLFLHCKL